ncbi:MAG: N-alpha-acetyl diaminobutyric acid deacetylase DoeB [Proteobacteria bacterium]|jgi:N-alpha-acetyl-L-2,4-diaminobutyrate deacetylase|nr:N-alpha-acetyl diaminobutyric acid deacetylase DoeB [Pseudomonadota bacterium]HJP06613.1 succinylglutamate desuccinylase/aspartoacylase family protein [Arenicellales bacterium]|tara:strand:+ start:5994 stop:7007 length:1014 start_codon:yes stop_codon:yes gene_type:complete
MTQTESKVSTTVDFSVDGKHYGHLSIPHSRNDSGWGALHLPIVSIRNGDGPTLVLTGGNHGDEYEGPIALMKLARSLDAQEINGQVIVIPALNYPAVLAGQRVSPIDGVNMNRAFPGSRDGSVSSMIAHFVHQKILPLADAVLDIHSGGKTMMFSPFACYHRLVDTDLMEKAKQAVLAFAAPVSLELVELDAEGMLDTAVEDLGKIFISCELGGGGTTTTGTVSIAEVGARNLLAHFNIINEQPQSLEDRGLSPTRLMHMPDANCYVISNDAGIYEALIDLNSPVKAGDAVGQVHFPEKPELPPAVYRVERSGVLVGRAHKALVESGDFLALIAAEI